MNRHIIFLQAEQTSYHRAPVLRYLAGRPDFELAVFEMCRAILRLQRAVRDEGDDVRAFDNFDVIAFEDGFNIAVLSQRARRRLLRERLRFSGILGAVLRAPFAEIPFDFEFFPRRLRRPPARLLPFRSPRQLRRPRPHRPRCRPDALRELP